MVKRNEPMKKEYLILIAVILLLGAYLVFHEESGDNFPLPSIVKMTPDKITGLSITKKQGTIELVKQDKTWVIKDIDRPADKTAMENMLDALKDLKISALVSQKKEIKRYELDPDNRVHVVVTEGGSTVFEFTMGKTAPTFNHTFVMLKQDSNIYHAKGSFRTYFDTSAADLRDKKVLEFTEKAVKTLTVEKDGKSKTFTAKEETGKDTEAGITWQSENAPVVDKESISELLSALSFLECDEFLSKDKKQSIENTAPFFRILLKSDKDHTLTLVKLKDDEPLAGISSMNPDAFTLSKFNGDDIVEKVDTLLGLKKETSE